MACSTPLPPRPRRRSDTRSRLPEIRNAWLGVSEILSGLLILVFALAGMSRRRNWVQWITAAVGVWVMFAPLVFWTTSAAAYSADTLIGMLVVAFAVMIPPTPGISRRALAADDDRPLGWSYSPSSFTQRMPIVALAFVGLFVSRYLAAYQLGHIDGLWDPFFGPGGTPAGNGSEAVVTSWVSKGFPDRRRRASAPLPMPSTSWPARSATAGAGAPCRGWCCCSAF